MQDAQAVDGGPSVATDARPPRQADLTSQWVLRYLADHGILTAADAKTALLAAEDLSVSHECIRVSVNGEARWVVKRADPIRSQGRDLGAETTVYRLPFVYPSLTAVLPACWRIDDRTGVIVLEAARGEILTPDIAWTPGQHTNAILRAYGAAVARVHSVSPPPFGELPWLLSALEPHWGSYEWLPRECARILAHLAASPSFCAGFRRARRDWLRVALVHGDVRWSNTIVELTAPPGVRLIDWELACVGDPAWDVGSMLGDVLAATLLWCPGPQRYRPLRAALPVLAGYQAIAQLFGDPWVRLLVRSVRLAGVRLVQTLVEHAHMGSEGLDQAQAVLLPWAAAFLTRPRAIGITTSAAVYSRTRDVAEQRDAAEFSSN